jgi:hypothetical protein
MTTRISSNNLDTSVTAQFGPKISGIVVTNDSYTNLDDTAVDIAGGYIKIIGTGFATGCQVLINTTPATSVTYISSTEVRAQLPATAAGTYVVYLVNTDGGVAIRFNGVTFSGIPTWSTSSALAGADTDSAISIQLAATGDTPMTYALQAGSSLPVGLSLNSSGLLSGAVTGLNNDTTYNFTVVATDAQLQDSPRAFSITITSGDPSWAYVSTLLNADVMPFNADTSTNNFAVSAFGDTRPNNFGPYTPGYYSVAMNGGTSGDLLSFPSSSTAYNLSGGTWTVEMWMYPTMSTFSDGDCRILMAGSNGTNSAWQLFINSNRLIGFGLPLGGTTSVFTSNGAFSFNTWTHVAVVCQVGSAIIYVNGVSAGGPTSITLPASVSVGFKIGYDNVGTVSTQFAGFITNVRINTTTAIYTAAFTPPTAPLTAVSGTSLLTCQSNRYLDTSTNALSVTVAGSPRISGFDPFVPATNYSTYGSTYFDGTGDYLSVPSNSAFAFGTGDYTIEAWVYITVSAAQAIVGNGDGAVANPYFYINGTTPTLFFNNAALASGPAIPLNAWTHVAVTRSGTLVQVFTNGVAGTGATNATSMISSGLTIGASSVPSQFITGYISNLRVVKGTAVYTSAFTPSTQPLTAIANTSLLTLQTNTPANNSVFIDNSTNNFLITRNGNTTQGTFSPYGAGWSNYFDGTGDFLSFPATAATSFGTGDYTIEFWIYLVGTGDFTVFDNQGSGGASQISRISGTLYHGSASTWSYTFTRDVWTHIAFSRQGTNLRLFANGALQQTQTNSSVVGSASNTNTIGMRNDNFYSFNGYLSNLRIVKGTAVYTAAFTPSATPLQPIANTSLLTCADPRFVDDSGNNFAITRNGDVSIQRFSPFAGTTLPAPAYSAYFDGTGDHLIVPAITPTAGNATVEFWIYPATTQAYIGDAFIVGTTDNTAGTWAISLSSNNTIGVWVDAYNSIKFVSTTAVNRTTWNHIALVKTGGIIYLYVNGVQQASTYSQAGTFGRNATIHIGQYSAGGQNFTGHISNLRIVYGTAVYTANFTPPTAPLTAIANTSLLTCQSATFTDNSTNAFSITAFGNSQPSLFSPFAVAYLTKQSYTPAVFGGSMYFDGTGDFLTVPDSTAFTMGAGDFTLECWINLSTISGSQIVIGTCDSGGSQGSMSFVLQVNSGTPRIGVGYNGAMYFATAASAITPNQWYHIAGVRNGASVYIYVNGVRSAPLDMAALAITDSSQVVGIGRNGNFNGEYVTGYISDLRIVKGQAVYTSNFAPPVAPLSFNANAVLQVNGTSAGVLDGSAMVNLETVGGAQISTSIKKYSTGSIYFDGTGDYLATNSTLITNFGAGLFTIESWVYFNSVSGTQYIMSTYQDSGTGWALGLFNSKFNFWSTGDGPDIVGTTTPVINTWYHLAASGQTGSIKLFVNGIQEGSTYTGATALNSTSTLRVGDGAGAAAGQALNGYLDDVRITRGAARYITTFTPPTGAFRGK